MLLIGHTVCKNLLLIP